MHKININGGVVSASMLCVGLGLNGCSQGPLAIAEGGAGHAAGASSGAPGSTAAEGNASGGGRSSEVTQNTGGKPGAPADHNTGGQTTSPPEQNTGGKAQNTGGAQISPVGGAAGSGAGGAAGTGGENDACAVALPLRCGDRRSHSTTVHGRPNRWGAYACTQRADNGRESIYAFRSDQDCAVEVRLADLTADLDLFLLDCDPSSCGSCSWDSSFEGFVDAAECSSIPLDLQDNFVETIDFDALAGEARTVVVDGYAQSEGTYTIEVDCVCPATSGSPGAR